MCLLRKYKCVLTSAVIKSRLKGIFREKIRRIWTVGGVLLRVDGTGVLIHGESGTGKSSCFLKLFPDGAQLVSDDVVEIRRGAGGKWTGRSPVRTRDLIEIRGLGIVNIRNLLGHEFIADETPINVIIELTRKERKRQSSPLSIIPASKEDTTVHRICADDPAKTAFMIKSIVTEYRGNKSDQNQ